MTGADGNTLSVAATRIRMSRLDAVAAGIREEMLWLLPVMRVQAAPLFELSSIVLFTPVRVSAAQLIVMPVGAITGFDNICNSLTDDAGTVGVPRTRTDTVAALSPICDLIIAVSVTLVQAPLPTLNSIASVTPRTASTNELYTALGAAALALRFIVAAAEAKLLTVAFARTVIVLPRIVETSVLPVAGTHKERPCLVS